MTDVKQVPLTFKRTSFTGYMWIRYRVCSQQIHMYIRLLERIDPAKEVEFVYIFVAPSTTKCYLILFLLN